MRVTVNGKQVEIHSGCRSYLYINQLIKVLELEQEPDIQITVNGYLVEKNKYAVADIKSADKVKITTEQ